MVSAPFTDEEEGSDEDEGEELRELKLKEELIRQLEAENERLRKESSLHSEISKVPQSDVATSQDSIDILISEGRTLFNTEELEEWIIYAKKFPWQKWHENSGSMLHHTKVTALTTSSWRKKPNYDSDEHVKSLLESYEWKNRAKGNYLIYQPPPGKPQHFRKPMSVL